MRNRGPNQLLSAAALLWVAACDPKASADQMSSKAHAGASALGEKAEQKAVDLGKGAKSAALAEVGSAAGAAKRKVFGVSDTGALSKSAVTWLGEKATDGSPEAAVKAGVQVLPVAAEAARVMNDVVDDETVVEPIVQKVEPGKEPELDKSVTSMPKLEVIDGLTVGFKRLDAIENAKIEKERAYLVLWRRETYLLGFLYRSKRTIDLEALVKATPKLMGLVHSQL
ncbi:MAG: hypothetical protein U0271_08845 [Polyangiaceae bacterium]